MDGVLRTTEVHVVHGEPHLREPEDLANTKLHGMYPTSRGHGETITVAPAENSHDGSSPSSSIVEFAGKGVEFAGKAV